MASFAVFGPKAQQSVHPAQVVLVRESFSFWGFLLPLPYCLWHRNWRFSGLLVLIGLGLSVLPSAGITVTEFSALGMELLMGLYVGFAAADIRAAALERRGYQVLDVAIARDEDAAFLRFLDDHFKPASHRNADTSTSTPSAGVPPAPSPYVQLGTSDVLGLFPESQR